jgi:DNA-binding beta-propeller fold protein YncE
LTVFNRGIDGLSEHRATQGLSDQTRTIGGIVVHTSKIFRFRRFFLILSFFLLASCTAGREAAPPPFLVWPLPPDPPRISYVMSIHQAKDIGVRASFFKKVVTFLFGSQVTPQIIRPMGIAVDGRGRLYVTDTGLQVVHLFDFANRSYRQIFWLVPSGPARLQNPIGVAVDGDDRIYVSDSVLNRIYVFDQKGSLLRTIGNDQEIERVSGIAIDAKRGILYAVDTSGHRLVVYDLSGKKIREIGHRGKGAGEFNFPTYVTVDRAGNVYVSDSLNFRVQIFSPEGKFLHAFGQLGNTLGTFSRPKGIAVDGEEHIYVVDGLYDTVQIFDLEGKLLLNFGRSGGKPGEFWLPAGIAIDPTEKIFVADSYNQRVQVFQFQGEKKGGSGGQGTAPGEEKKG